MTAPDPAAARPTLSLGLPTFGHAAPAAGWRTVLDLARTAEDGGVDRVIVTDHVVNGPDVADYPWGRFPTGPEGHWLEPLAVLTGIAAVTTTLRLGTGVLIAPLRPAPLLAKQVATLDQLSDGRVDLGVGTGWQRAEFEAFGLDFSARGRMLTETIAACRALWTGEPATFRSETADFAAVCCAPPPVQPRLPVWFSGTLHARNVGRIVELGDGWIPIMGATTDDVRAGVATLTAAFADTGRDPAELRVRHALPVVRDTGGRPDPAATMAAVPAMVEAGATDVQASLQAWDPDLARPKATIEALVAAFDRAVS